MVSYKVILMIDKNGKMSDIIDKNDINFIKTIIKKKK